MEPVDEVAVAKAAAVLGQRHRAAVLDEYGKVVKPGFLVRPGAPGRRGRVRVGSG
ncbi:hypothetical protein [Kitasatospora sp. NPDC088783]|uniref:hypothetical protein n=1 Tax=Kitasatospora sp. NPDC088783 TaxID=3364077 RepID=UPI003811D6FF